MPLPTLVGGANQQMSEAKRLTYLAAGAALLLLVVLVNPPTHTTFMYVLHKSAHPAVFAAIALIFLKLVAVTNEGDWWKRYVGAFLVVIACGVGTEIAQSWLDRNPSLQDVIRDAVGGTASLAIALLVQRWIRMSRTVRALFVLLATAATFAAVMPLAWCVSAYANRDLLFPIILEYRSPLDMYFVKVWTGDVPGVNLPTEWTARRDEKAIEVNLEFWKPGIRLFETYPDWRGYNTLLVDVTNPNPMQVDLVVRINAESPDYCDVPFELEPRTRSTLRLRLDEIAPARLCHELNRSEMAGMAIFALKTMAGGKLYVNRIALE
jgi:VanZ family protein